MILIVLINKLMIDIFIYFDLTAPSQSSDNQRNSDSSDHFPSGRITPPATNLPRFKKYNMTDFNFLKVSQLGARLPIITNDISACDDCVHRDTCNFRTYAKISSWKFRWWNAQIIIRYKMMKSTHQTIFPPSATRVIKPLYINFIWNNKKCLYFVQLLPY